MTFGSHWQIEVAKYSCGLEEQRRVTARVHSSERTVNNPYALFPEEIGKPVATKAAQLL
jgi:hypothetical protein